MKTRSKLLAATLSSLIATVGLIACGVTDGPSLLGGKASSPSSGAGGGRTVPQPATISCNPAGAPFGGGDGLSASTAFAICTQAQISEIQNAGVKYFILAADIDLSNGLYTPQSMVGELDGNFHKILNLTLSGVGQQSLFTLVQSGSVIKNLGFTNVNITSAIGSSYDGGAPLAFFNQGAVSGCFAQGTIVGNGGTNKLGGLVVNNIGTVSNSYTVVQFTDNTGNAEMGGIASYQGGTTTNSYSIPTFTQAAGSIVGGLTATGAGNSNNSFWDATVSGISTMGGSGTAVSKTTAQLKTASTFSGAAWSSTIWYYADGSYPVFVWQP